MSDSELIDYCVAHCETSVGAISGGMFARLHELAGRDVEAGYARQRAWWNPEPEWVNTLAKEARERMVQPIVAVLDAAIVDEVQL